MNPIDRKVTGFVAKGVTLYQVGRAMSWIIMTRTFAVTYLATRMNTNLNDNPKISVLFVCLGNICRSPLAEGVFRYLVEDQGLTNQFLIDSAGTGSWHVGERPDGRAALVAEQHGINLDSRARQIQDEDFSRFDYIIAMDRENLGVLSKLKAEMNSDTQITLLRSHDPNGCAEDEVPDPYYGGASGFENVYQLVKQSCKGLLQQLHAA